jgi:DNA mismatch repair protein MutS2
MGSGAVQVDDLLGRLTEEVDRESEARAKAESIAQELETERRELAAANEALIRQKQEVYDSTRREAMALVRDIERRGKEVLARMREAGDQAKPLLRNNILEAKVEIKRRFPSPPPRKGHGPIIQGEDVDVLSLGVRGSVTELLAGGREAEVLSGGIRMRVPVDDLAPAASGNSDARPARTGNISYKGSSDSPTEINLVGVKVEDALQSLDKALDRSLLGPGRFLRVVHGKGTGALKNAVSGALKGDPRVLAFGPAPLNEGGAGVTIVELKE